MLTPTDYGHFSYVYLLFAFGVSLQYSVLSEAWARNSRQGGLPTTWTQYSTTLIELSGLVGTVGIVVAIATPGLHSTGWILALAAAFALYRNGARYYSAATGSTVRVLVSDLSGVVAFAVSLVATADVADGMRVAVTWLAAAVISSLTLKLAHVRAGSGLFAWIKEHRASIRPLLLDSLMMDIGAIGTPLVLAGPLGASNFGIYRAVSNVALPVRLLIDPIRPMLGRASPRVLFGRAASFAIGSATVVLSLSCYFALTSLLPFVGFQLGTLSSLVPYAPACSAFVAGSMLGTIYYIACRTTATHREIMTGRIAQTGLVIVLPILGLLLFQLSGAIWGFALSSVISALVWIWLARAGARTPRTLQ
jgi:hypothetical protein